jgi:hypothetical protein
MLILIRLPLHYFESLAIPRLLHLRTCAALHSRTEQTSSSIAGMTFGSIRTSFIDTSPVGEHSEKRASDLTGVHIFYGVKSELFL